MTKIKTILMVVCCLLFAFAQVLAQTQTVNGKVTGDDGEPFAVQIKGTSSGTVTDAGGKFRLQLPAGAESLVVSFVGLITQEVEIGNRTEFNVKLLADEKLLSEVVVTAVGIERDTRKLGYSIQEVNRAAISQQSTPDVAQALQGKFAGVQILQGSGSPGAAASVVIRGNKLVNGSNQALVMARADYRQLTGIAHALNYTDQSHFIKDFRDFSDMSPYEFVKKDNIGSESSSFIYPPSPQN